jgi:hypothetical protein
MGGSLQYGLHKNKILKKLNNLFGRYMGKTKTVPFYSSLPYATQEKCIVPLSWSVKKEAGRDWLSGFMRRRQDLSIRKPQATSLSRATSFNKHYVDSFFDNVEVELQVRDAHWLQSALQYLPQGSLFHHILSFHGNILFN